MLRLEHVNVIFDESTSLEKTVLKDFNLHVNKGDFVCILGSNGAGKSTLFNAITGSIPYYGNIFLEDKNINKMKKYKRMSQIGIVYQDPLKGSAPHLLVEENILLASKEKSFLKFGFKRKFHELVKNDLASFGLHLEDNMNTTCEKLSGGMRQAMSLYMSTFKEPKLLLLDEHTAALDPNTQEKIMDITSSLIKKKEITTLMITHNLKSALKYGNRLIILNDGKVALDVRDEEKANLNEEKLLQMYSSSLSDGTILSSINKKI